MADEIEMVAQDAVLHGTGYMQAGKRIDPSEVHAPMTTLTQAELDDLRQKAEAVGGAWSYVPAHIAEGPSQVRHREGWLVCEVPSDEIADFIARSSIAIPALLDHIAQLTEENALSRAKIEKMICEKEGAVCIENYYDLLKEFGIPCVTHTPGCDYFISPFDALVAWKREAEARIAELEAQPSASDEMRQLARELRENANGDCGAVAQAIYWDKKAAALEAQAAQPSAQFVAGMRRAAEIARTRVTTSFDDCERGGTDPSTGAHECSLDSRGRDCLCVEHQEEAEAIATAILAEAALKGEGE